MIKLVKIFNMDSGKVPEIIFLKNIAYENVQKYYR